MPTLPTAPTICIVFADNATDVDALVPPDEGGYRTSVPLEGSEGDLPRGVEEFLSGGAGLESFSLFQMLDEDHIPYISVNTPGRSHTREHVGHAEGPGLDAPPQTQLVALREAATAQWDALVAILKGPFDLQEVREVLERAEENTGERPFLIVASLPPEGEGKIVVKGPGVRDETSELGAPPEAVCATFLSVVGAHVPTAVEANPLPIIASESVEPGRPYLTR